MYFTSNKNIIKTTKTKKHFPPDINPWLAAKDLTVPGRCMAYGGGCPGMDPDFPNRHSLVSWEQPRQGVPVGTGDTVMFLPGQGKPPRKGELPVGDGA